MRICPKSLANHPQEWFSRDADTSDVGQIWPTSAGIGQNRSMLAILGRSRACLRRNRQHCIDWPMYQHRLDTLIGGHFGAKPGQCCSLRPEARVVEENAASALWVCIRTTLRSLVYLFGAMRGMPRLGGLRDSRIVPDDELPRFASILFGSCALSRDPGPRRAQGRGRALRRANAHGRSVIWPSFGATLMCAWARRCPDAYKSRICAESQCLMLLAP